MEFVDSGHAEALRRLAREHADERIRERPFSHGGDLASLAGAAFHSMIHPGITKAPAIDLRGTDFQIAVWTLLLEIPAGTTATYRWVAERIGRPHAVRAVANAIGRNRIAGLVPCHRVIRSDGALGGYRWGIERKSTLLVREKGALAGRRHLAAA